MCKIAEEVTRYYMTNIANFTAQLYFTIDSKNFIIGVLFSIITNITTNGIPIVTEFILITRTTNFI